MNDSQKLTPAEDIEKRPQEIAESEWHLANATVDVHAFINEFPVGDVVRDVMVFDTKLAIKMVIPKITMIAR